MQGLKKEEFTRENKSTLKTLAWGIFYLSMIDVTGVLIYIIANDTISRDNYMRLRAFGYPGGILLAASIITLCFLNNKGNSCNFSFWDRKVKNNEDKLEEGDRSDLSSSYGGKLN